MVNLIGNTQTKRGSKMAELVYKQIIADLKNKIFAGEFADMKLPDERSLSEHYQVSRSSIKRALSKMAREGIIFKKRGSGTFINPLYLQSESVFNYEEGSNLGVSDNFKLNGKKPQTKVLSFKVISPNDTLRKNLFLKPGEFVYKIKRLRLFDDQPFMIETGYIPIKILPQLTHEHLESSIFKYVQATLKQTASKSFMSISAEPSTMEDQALLKLKPNEPTSVMEGIFFLDNGTPFEFSSMRLHYKFAKFNTFIDIN